MLVFSIFLLYRSSQPQLPRSQSTQSLATPKDGASKHNQRGHSGKVTRSRSESPPGGSSAAARGTENAMEVRGTNISLKQGNIVDHKVIRFQLTLQKKSLYDIHKYKES